MDRAVMLNSHQAAASCGSADATPWAWSLEPRQATTLAAASTERWLQVESGAAWLTRANGADQAEDIWLQAGESRVLPAGTEWVVEGWPQARLSLHLQARMLAPRGAGLFMSAGVKSSSVSLAPSGLRRALRSFRALASRLSP